MVDLNKMGLSRVGEGVGASYGAAAAAGFPTNSVLDDFNRTNENPLAGSWGGVIHSGHTNLQVVSNVCTTTAGNDSAYYNTSYNANQESYAKITAITSSGLIYIGIRLANVGGTTPDGYFVRYKFDDAELVLVRMDDGSVSNIGSIDTIGLTVGDSLGISASGTTIKAWYKVGAGSWVESDSLTDATYNSSGYVGLIIGFNGSVDDFGGGNI